MVLLRLVGRTSQTMSIRLELWLPDTFNCNCNACPSSTRCIRCICPGPDRYSRNFILYSIGKLTLNIFLAWPAHEVCCMYTSYQKSHMLHNPVGCRLCTNSEIQGFYACAEGRKKLSCMHSFYSTIPAEDANILANIFTA